MTGHTHCMGLSSNILVVPDLQLSKNPPEPVLLMKAFFSHSLYSLNMHTSPVIYTENANNNVRSLG